jgi:hypothetical protein
MLPTALVYSLVQAPTPSSSGIDAFVHNISKLCIPASIIPLRSTFDIGIVGWNIHDQRVLLELILAISATNNTLVVKSQQLLEISTWISNVNPTVNELICIYKEVIRMKPNNNNITDLFNRIIELQI